MTDWKKYEKELFTKYSNEYPNHIITIDDKIVGQFSKIKRQVDISIKKDVAGYKVLGVIECKYYNKKVDVKIVDAFIGFLEDVKANFGIIITNQGFSTAAKNRAEVKGIELIIHKFKSVDNLINDVDLFFNQRINELKLEEQEFIRRVKEYTGYIDSSKIDFDNRVIYYREGFANTEYYAWKKLMQQTLRVFRDFPTIEKIEIYIPATKEYIENSNLIHEKRIYTSKIHLKDFEKYMDVKFEFLKKDIKNWRKFFDSIKINNKTFVTEFAKKYVSSELIEKL
ncbi:restriction endonuclease [Bernardetia sp.]|uniref:restriction endonuclease n=1 Tax=Bernardetia sp. TaxID=1937974 RepID=UPI0025C05716|nr:restriction endonuclease [Bernardetia sp.]